MAVIIRLSRMGRKNLSRYRIVAADSRMKRDGRFLETLGTYNPEAQPKQFSIKSDRVEYWLKQGAAVSDTMRSLLKQDRHVEKVEAIGKGIDPATIERKAEAKRKPKKRAKDAPKAA